MGRRRREAYVHSDEGKIMVLLADLVSRQNFVTIGIDGKPASGKTTYAATLKKNFHCKVIHMDEYPMEAVEEKVDQARSELAQWIQRDQRKHRICIVEGSDALHPALRRYYDLTISMDRDEEVCVQKLEKGPTRPVESVG